MPNVTNPVISDPPVQTPLVEGILQYFSRPWIQWLQAVCTALNRLPQQNSFATDGVQTDFPLTRAPLGGIVTAAVNGALVSPTTYTISGAHIIFAPIAPAGGTLLVTYT